MNMTRNESTSATCPRHIWMHEVLMAAGVTVDAASPQRARLNSWYNAGEPVWMAADGIRFLVRQVAIEARAAADDPIRVRAR